MDVLWLALAAFAAGFIDAVAGGGGLIQVPALMAVFPRELPPVLFGTNKAASVWGSLNAAWRYGRQLALPWREVLVPAALASGIAAFFGAAAVTVLDKQLVRPLVVVLLLAVLIYTVVKPDFGRLAGRPAQHPRRTALLVGATIGFYDGLLGPGTGSFLIFAFVRWFGFDFLRASACAKIVNVTTNVAALSWFLPHGQWLAAAALVMAVCNVAGSFVGSHLALKHGAGFVRLAFLGVTSALLAKVAFDLFR